MLNYDLYLRGQGVFLVDASMQSISLASSGALIYNVPRIIIVRYVAIEGIPDADSVEIVYIGCMNIGGPKACFRELRKLRKADKTSKYVVPMLGIGPV